MCWSPATVIRRLRALDRVSGYIDDHRRCSNLHERVDHLVFE
jgi:hypothetical protein